MPIYFNIQLGIMNFTVKFVDIGGGVIDQLNQRAIFDQLSTQSNSTQEE